MGNLCGEGRTAAASVVGPAVAAWTAGMGSHNTEACVQVRSGCSYALYYVIVVPLIHAVKAEQRLPAPWVQRLRLGQQAWGLKTWKPVYR